MKKLTKIVLGFLMLVFLFPSCEKGLQEVNTNPNQLNDTRPEFLFTSATLNYTLGRRDQLMSKYSTTMRYMQYIVGDDISKDGMEAPYYDPTKSSFPNPGGALYSDYFTARGRDYHRIIEKIDEMEEGAVKESYRNLKAVTQIMDTYDAWKIADVYGAMPYSEAFNVTEFPVPPYDFDWELYSQFDAQLKESADALKMDPSGQQDFSEQDFFYMGDWDKWLRFTNTLRIKIAQRYAERDPSHLTSVVNDIATNYGGMIISSNDESFGYSNLEGWNNNTNDIDAILTTYVAAFPFVEFLKSTDDPRLALMVRQNDWGANSEEYNNIKANGTPQSIATVDSADLNTSRYWGKHVFSASTGSAYGWQGQPKAHQFSLDDGTQEPLNFISVIQGRLFVKNGGFGNSLTGEVGLHTDETIVDGNTIKMRTPLLTYAETCFMMAEIAEKSGNGLGKSAALWYADGVAASFAQYKAKAIAGNVPGADAVMLGDYLTRYPYNGLASIYSQAWVHFLTQPEEAWAMWKRTGYPQFEDYRAGQPSQIGDGSGIAYLESLYTGTQDLIVPRRAVLPSTSEEMRGNHADAVQQLIAKDASYGTDEFDTKGRIWWDMQ